MYNLNINPIINLKNENENEKVFFYSDCRHVAVVGMQFGQLKHKGTKCACAGRNGGGNR
jgi:hypothetical protein